MPRTHFKPSRPVLMLVSFLVEIFLFFPVPSSANAGSVLENVLKSTLEKNGMVQEVAQDLEVARSQLQLAQAALYPRGSLTLLFAPIFEERGNALHSASDWGKWGGFAQLNTVLVQPLYTFGQISNYRKAAEEQVVAKQELVQVKKNEVVFTAKEFFYGYQLASSLEGLVSDLVQYLEEASATAEKNIAKKEGTVKQHDLYKLKTSLDDLKQKLLLAKQSKKTAEQAVSWISSGQFEQLAKEKLGPEKFDFLSMDEYLTLSKHHRPEFKALEAGIEARDALKKAKESQSYPVLFAGGFAQLGYTQMRDRQPSAFAYDPFNAMWAGAGVGLRFDLEYQRHSAEASEQEAEKMKLQATQSYAIPGIELQVKRAFWELEQAKEGLVIAEARRDMAKKWFVSSAMGWSIGLTPAKELMEALEASGLAKKNYFETVYQHNLAAAKLSQAVGKEVAALTY